MELGSNRGNDGEVAYFHEIVRELSEEFDIDEKEMKEICSLSLDYVKSLTKKKSTMAILLPNLGVLCFNMSLGKFYRNWLRQHKNEDEIMNLNHRLKVAEESGAKRYKKRPFLYKFKRILKKKGLPIPKGGATVGQKELWTTISKMQNEINSE